MATISVIGDTLSETDETFFVNLTNAAGATIQTGQGVGIIQNDDVAPIYMKINDINQLEGNSGTTVLPTVMIDQKSTVWRSQFSSIVLLPKTEIHLYRITSSDTSSTF